MGENKIFRSVILLLFFLFAITCYSQGTYTINKNQTNEECPKGTAGFALTGQNPTDNVTVTWSSGQTGVYSLSELNAGDYSARIVIKNIKDSLLLDSTINFKIEKEDCIVSASNHFTPNADAYNDQWQIGNTGNYPNFELYVFNKWGQQVHSQKGTYTPWDGKWNGINVPDGTYYYVFYYDGGQKNKFVKGDVTVLR